VKKVLNVILSILKIILLFVSFVLTFYIIMAMYQRLEKSFLESLDIFIPYVVLLILLLLNHVLGQKHVTSNTFYNLTCCLVFSLFIFVAYRTMFDNYMLLSLRNTYKMSFYYFSDMIQPLKALLYLLITGNVSLIIYGAISKKEAEEIKRQEMLNSINNKNSSKSKTTKKSTRKKVQEV